jgi:hypothetical protein
MTKGLEFLHQLRGEGNCEAFGLVGKEFLVVLVRQDTLKVIVTELRPRSGY